MNTAHWRCAAVGLVLGSAIAAAPAFTIVLDLPTMAQAQAMVQQQDYAGAIEAYRAITAADPANEQAWFMLGFALHGAGQLDEAIEIHKKVGAFNNPQLRATATYNLGCAYALQGKQDDAFAALQRSIDLGLANKPQFEGDTDLTALKGDPRWAGLMKTLDEAQTSPIDRALSFWVGQWECYDQSGVLNGANTLSWRLNNKVIHESWASAGAAGFKGESWNWFDPAARVWKQVWVDQNSVPQEFAGSRREGGIDFKGTRTLPDGSTALVGMFVRPIGQGRVRQTGTESTDGGATWATRYDLTYVPKGQPFGAPGSDEAEANAQTAAEPSGVDAGG